MDAEPDVGIVMDRHACHKGQGQKASPCLNRMAAAASGCCTCDRGAGHQGRCHCGTCGRWYLGGESPPRVGAIQYADVAVLELDAG